MVHLVDFRHCFFPLKHFCSIYLFCDRCFTLNCSRHLNILSLSKSYGRFNFITRRVDKGSNLSIRHPKNFKGSPCRFLPLSYLLKFFIAFIWVLWQMLHVELPSLGTYTYRAYPRYTCFNLTSNWKIDKESNKICCLAWGLENQSKIILYKNKFPYTTLKNFKGPRLCFFF